MAFLVLEVLSGLEIDGVSQIFTLFKNVADGGRTPAVHIFESLVFVHALAVLGKVSGRNEDFFFFQFAGDLIRTVALNRHGKMRFTTSAASGSTNHWSLASFQR
ncbi:hypothetical protein KKZ20_16570 [Clostridioides difficile]|nr:hypothetical protein [Clostridioides difficile]